MATVVDAEFLKGLYETLYSARNIVHPKLGKMANYGGPSGRDTRLFNITRRCLPDGGRVLDASCGRGHLLRRLIDVGYEGHGTEVVDCLLEEDLAGLQVEKVDYANLGTHFPHRWFDAVISNDVLEHLRGEEEIEEGFRNLAKISRGYLIVSVGLKYACKYATACKLEVQSLHRVRKPGAWWREKFEKVADVEKAYVDNVNWWGFGKVLI